MIPAPHSRLPVLLLVLGLCACSGSDPLSDDAPATTPDAGGAQIKVLSNRSDMISGDDALVEVVFAETADPASARVTLNGIDITTAFAQRSNGRYMGRVEGMQLGANLLSVEAAGGASGSVTVVNHPNGGPIFSAPQVPRYRCQDSAVDAQCNQPAEYSYLYKSSNPAQSGLLPYDPDNPPTDVATTTTDDGVTLPFVVRQERGYQNRDEYRILTLFRPGEDWQPWAPQDQWNHKLLITHGGSCGYDYHPASAPLNDYSGTIPENPLFEQSYVTALGRGYAVMSAAMANTGHNCDVPSAAEALMMAKERLVEQYGELRYTIGTGCSGGSIAQATIANAYPGIYQGLLTMCAYPDTLSAGLQFADLHLMRLYFEDPSKWGQGIVWLPTQWGDVEGHLTHLNAVTADEGLFKGATNPAGDCYGEQSYDPQNNPGGIRCSILDAMAHIFGLRTPDVWSPMEQAAGHGFAALPLGNRGVQYGLTTLQQGRITPAQFVDLNVNIGGLDIDIQPQAERTHADHRAIANSYRSGFIDVGNNLDTVPIINFVGPDPGIAHDSLHAWWVRWRLDREHGQHDNHVMWAGPIPLVGDLNYVYQGITAMDRWLSAIEQDVTDRPIAEKIVANKPADIHDQCSDGLGQKILDDVCVDLVQPLYAYGTPRTVAGDDIYGYSLECQLKPFSRDDDYGLIPFTEDQWQQLEALFADGVCDYSKPPVNLQPTVTWLKYRDAQGEVIVGGEPLPPVPAHSRDGWQSPAFRY
ncbi:MAG: DUF6351 family protein [Nevskiales bacterium]|nr:DUF6351 family protein [Nevskiales bacterium]